jgi:immune inhibitor A
MYYKISKLRGVNIRMYKNTNLRVSPSPELLEKIKRSMEQISAGEKLPQATNADYLDVHSLGLILTRPSATRAHTMLAALQREFAPVVGSRKALVLLVDFPDKKATQSQQHYNDMLFSKGSYATGSLRDFYWEASYHTLDITGTVSGQGGVTVGWYRAPQPYSYYTNNDFGWGGYPQNSQKLTEDIVDLATPHVNFADYDNDGDGIVDALFIIHAGTGGETTGNPQDIWSHAWGIVPKSVHGVKVSGYSIEPEDGRVGVFCHELGHVFGLPDLYDYDKGSSASAGNGSWDLMAGGSWNKGGDRPAHPVGWCKIKLGWVNPTVVFNQALNATIKPCESNPQIYKLPIKTNTSKEYFLLENRQRIGFDDNLPGDGLLITHVDENQTNNNDQTHYLVGIEQADGKMDLNKNANRGDSGDPYPYGNNNVFDVNSNPNSKAYDNSGSLVAVTSIARSGQDINASINVGGVAIIAWYNNVKVMATFAHYTTQWAWANISGLGWRRIKDGSPDGVTNMFTACCEAVANNRSVNVYADENFIYTMYVL